MAGIALFAWLGRLDLLDPDEGRHAEIAREMLAAGRWLTPVLHGEPYYEKPAAFYWLLMASMRLFGLDAGPARLPSALAAFWTVFASAAFARRAYSANAGLHVVAGLSTTIGFVVLGRIVLVDMPFAAAMTSAFVWLGLWYLDPSDARRRIWPFYVALGIAVLLKGPAALAIASLAVAALALVERNPGLVLALRPLRGALLVGAIVVPWYVAAWRADPSYIVTFLLRNNLERYLRPIGAGHVEPWYYYLVALPVALLPWTPAVALAARARLRASVRTRADTFCAVWAGAVLVFFAPAGTKLVTYLLPAFPALACLAAAWSADHAATARFRRLLAPWTAAWASFVAVAVCAATLYAAVGPVRLSPTRLALAVVAIAVLAPAFRARRAAADTPLFAATAAAALALVVFAYGAAADAVNALRDVRTAAAIVRVRTQPGGAFVAYRCVPNAVAFYARVPALRTRDANVAVGALEDAPTGVVLTKWKRLGELGVAPASPTIRAVWRNVSGAVLLAPAQTAAGTRLAEKGGSRTLRRP